MTTCGSCKGKKHVKCPKCNGKGRIVPLLGSGYQCKNCNGSGVVKCGACDGKGYY